MPLVLSDQQVLDLANTLQDNNLTINEALDMLSLPSAEGIDEASFHKLSDYVFYCYTCRRWLEAANMSAEMKANLCANCEQAA